MVIVAYLHSQLHLNSFRAYYAKCCKLGENISGTIYILCDKEGRYLIDESELSFAFGLNIKMMKKPSRNSILKVLGYIKRVILSIVYSKLFILTQKPGKTLFFLVRGGSKICARDLFIYQKREHASNVKVVYLEEGIGYYIRSRNRWLNRGLETKRGIKKILSHFVRRVANYIDNDQVVQELLRRKQIEYFNLFDNIDGKLTPNMDVCLAFAEVYKMRAQELKVSTDYSNTIIVNTQPFMEELNCNQDLECYKLLDCLCKGHGMRLLIKPHPREIKIDRYINFGLDVDLNNSHISQEILIAGADSSPLAIVGFFSTTLVTAHLLFEVPVISLGRLCEEQVYGGYKEDIQAFMDTFEHIMFIPKSLPDLEVHFVDYVKMRQRL